MKFSTKNNDLTDSLSEYSVWLYLAQQDIKIKYRDSVIGPFSAVSTTAIFIFILGFVYSQVLGKDIEEYFPFLTVGIILYRFYSSLIINFSGVFNKNKRYIINRKVNLLSILFRVFAHNIIILSYSVIIIIGVYVYFGVNPGILVVVGLLSFALFILNLFAIGVALSILGTRYKDVKEVTAVVMRIMFFITPVIWSRRFVPADSWWVLGNPFACYLDLIRSPLLGQLPSTHSWFIALLSLLFCSLLAIKLYKSKADRIPYWL